MLYARIDGGAVSQYPITESNIRSQNPNTSFPAGQLSPNTMLESGCYPVTETSAAFDSNTQRPVEGTPVLVDGQWRQVWTVVDLTAQEIADRNAAQWSVVRLERNSLLTSSDWTQLPDAPVDNLSWSVYRQALRDITLQPDPFSIVWPTST